MRKEVKDIRARMHKLLKDLSDLSQDSKVKSIKVGDKGYWESASGFLQMWIPRGELLLKRLDAIIDSLPKEKRESKKVEVKERPKKLSLRLLQLSKLTNPKDLVVVWASGRKQLDSRTELAKILREIRRLERVK